MVLTELISLEVREEFVFADSVEFEEATLSEAPERLDAIDAVLAPSKLVFVVMNTMISESAGHQAIAGFPAVGVNVALGRTFSLRAAINSALEQFWTAPTKTQSLRS